MKPIVWLDHNPARLKLADKIIIENKLSAHTVRSSESFLHFIDDIAPSKIFVFLDNDDSVQIISELQQYNDIKATEVIYLAKEEIPEISFTFKALPVKPWDLLNL